MIERLGKKNLLDLVEFFNKVYDKYEDMYITINKERKFLKKNWFLIEKILKTQEVYGIFNNGLKGLLIILHEKGYRPYIKLLAESNKNYYDLMIYLRFNFMNQELFAKLKINNPLVEILERKGFINIGMRGREVLLHKKAIREFYKITPKDNYLVDEEKRLY